MSELISRRRKGVAAIQTSRATLTRNGPPYGQSSVARNATAVTGPTPGVVASRRATGSPASRRATRASAAAMAALSGLSRATSGAIRAAGGRGTQLERVRVARPGGPPHRRDPAVPGVARNGDQGPGRSGPARALARVRRRARDRQAGGALGSALADGTPQVARIRTIPHSGSSDD